MMGRDFAMRVQSNFTLIFSRAVRKSRAFRTIHALFFCFVLLIAFLPASVFAFQDAPDDLQITVGQFDASQYPEITLYVNVTDSAGIHVTDLAAEDFMVTEDGEPVELIEFAGIGESRPVDIVYVFDTTGSMRDEIDGVINTSIKFADELESKGRDYRLGLVTFADRVLDVYRQDGSLTDEAQIFKDWVGELEADGGDDEPENDYAAIKRALDLLYRVDSQKIMILITDAPPHVLGDPPDGGEEFDDPDLDFAPILALLQADNFSLYAVTPDLAAFTDLSSETGGRFYDIDRNPDFSGIIEDIGEVIANQYRITYRSPRPTYDGTRRDVRVRIGESGASAEYHEQHLLTVRSNLLVGICCLVPLLGMAVVPFGVQYLIRQNAAKQPPLTEAQPVSVPAKEAPAPQQQVVTAAPKISCQNCGRMLNPGARFCPGCGRPVTESAQSPPVEAPPLSRGMICPHCGQALRAGAKFCNRCGNPL